MHGYTKFSDGCACSSFKSYVTGLGNCEDLWENRLWCYVRQPSNCTDLHNSTLHFGKQWSWNACNTRRGKPF